MNENLTLEPSAFKLMFAMITDIKNAKPHGISPAAIFAAWIDFVSIETFDKLISYATQTGMVELRDQMLYWRGETNNELS